MEEKKVKDENEDRKIENEENSSKIMSRGRNTNEENKKGVKQ